MNINLGKIARGHIKNSLTLSLAMATSDLHQYLLMSENMTGKHLQRIQQEIQACENEIRSLRQLIRRFEHSS